MKTGNEETGGFVNYHNGTSGKNKDIAKFHDAMQSLKHYCPNCGHSVTIVNFVDRNLCNHCGTWVYRDKATEFRYKMEKELKKVNNER